MAWIKVDPIEVKKHPKFHAFKKKLGWESHQAFGFLCAFWGEVANTDANDTGDISDWTPDYLADRIGVSSEPNRLWEALVPGYIEIRTTDRYFVKDWLEIAGPYLVQKYHRTDHDRNVSTWANYGRIYGRSSKGKSEESGGKEEDDTGRLSNESHLKVDSLDAKNRTFGPTEFTVSPTPPSSRDSKALIPLRGDKKSPVGFSPDKSKPEETGNDKSAVTILQRLFHKQLCESLGEQPPNWDWGLAGRIFRDELLAVADVDTIASRLPDWFRSTATFIVNQSFSIKLLPMFFTALKNGPIANQVGSNGKRAFNDGAATVGAD